MKYKFIILSSILSTAISGQAKIEMPNIFTDNMVIQADTAVAMWCKATWTME